jgi:outer membrane lipopolysaccharide assembly protein LptE/RlpB
MRYMKNFIIICLFSFIVACGYQFEGGGYINKDVTRVAVKVLGNKSAETGADVIFTNALIREILQKTDTKVVDEATATAVIEGTIKAITFSSLSRATVESVTERRVSAVMDFKMVSKDGEVIWSAMDLRSNESYNASQDRAADESNKGTALEKIAVRSAERVVSRMLSNF